MTKKIGKLKLHFSKQGAAFKWGDGEIHRLSFDRFRKNADGAGDYTDEENRAYSDDYAERGYQAGRYSDVLYSSDWLMYLLLVIFPPLGIWILWKRERFTPLIRSVASAISAIWFIVLLVWLFSAILNTGGSDTTTPVSAPTQPTQVTQPLDQTTLGDDSNDVIATPAPTPLAAANPVTGDLSGETDVDSEDPSTGADASGTDSSGTTYCYSASSGTFYHSRPDCPDIEQGASRVSLQLARQRGQTACPSCHDAAGDSESANFYIASTGKYYHKTKACSRLKGKSGITAITKTAAVSAGKTACPTCIGSYWHTKNGKYYHSKQHCSGMSSATQVTKAAAAKAGQKPCPVCIGGKASGSSSSSGSTAAKYYATSKGKYYHVNQKCSGMTDAKQTTLAAAKKRHQTACPVCIGSKTSTGSGNYFATRNGTYYHTKSDCSGMKGATKITLTSAKKAGKKACPICVPSSSSSAKKSSTTSSSKSKTTTTSSSAATYYATAKGVYYHKNATCNDMKNAKKVTKATAVKNGLKPCPVCLTAQATKVYSTTGGRYYHKTSTCSGMKNARSMSMASAQKQGKTACPVCFKAQASKGSYCFSNSNNRYYHTKKNCSGMVNATKMTVATAKKKGKTACPICVNAKKSDTQYFFATKNNKYYHNKSNCSGMTGASKVTLAQAKSAGKTACPVCVTKTVANPTPAPNKKVYCYAASGSRYYHKLKACSGLKNAKKVLLSKAKSAGKTACPICVLKIVKAKTQTTSYANKTTACYASSASAYYHRDKNCVSGLKKTTVASAIKKGKAPCPSCAKGLNTYVYVTKNGLRYHRKSNCSGNVNPYKISLSTAVKLNYTRCPKCNAPKAK